MKCYNYKQLVFFFFLSAAVLPSGLFGMGHSGKGGGSTLFRAINCRVLDKDNKPMSVVAFRNMRMKEEVILISPTANHALIVNLKEQKAYKVSKPILGENAVNVPDFRPEQNGNVSFHVLTEKNNVTLTEIVVDFGDDGCFLCLPMVFAAIWD